MSTPGPGTRTRKTNCELGRPRTGSRLGGTDRTGRHRGGDSDRRYLPGRAGDGPGAGTGGRGGRRPGAAAQDRSVGPGPGPGAAVPGPAWPGRTPHRGTAGPAVRRGAVADTAGGVRRVGRSLGHADAQPGRRASPRPRRHRPGPPGQRHHRALADRPETRLPDRPGHGTAAAPRAVIHGRRRIGCPPPRRLSARDIRGRLATWSPRAAGRLRDAGAGR